MVNVRDRGLVVLTGCGHSGIMNIVRHAQKLTGDDKHPRAGRRPPPQRPVVREDHRAHLDALTEFSPDYLVSHALHRPPRAARDRRQIPRRVHPEQRRHTTRIRCVRAHAKPPLLARNETRLYASSEELIEGSDVRHSLPVAVDGAVDDHGAGRDVPSSSGALGSIMAGRERRLQLLGPRQRGSW